MMRLHGMSRDAFDRFTATVPSWYYEIVAPGFKYNLTDIAAALGLQQLKGRAAFQRRARRSPAAYNDALRGAAAADCRRPPPPATCTPGTCTWCAWPTARRSRATLHRAPVRAGIGCSVHYIPLHLQPYWRDRYGLTPEMFPHSQHAYERLVSLPIYTRMTDADVERVVRAVRAGGRRWIGVLMAKRAVRSRRWPCWLAAAGARCCWPSRCWIKLDSPGPVFFRQQRVGRNGGRFASTSSARCRWVRPRGARRDHVGADARITRAGALAAPHRARRTAAADRRARRRHEPGRPAARGAALRGAVPAALREQVLAVRPGITDPASLEFRDEAARWPRRRPRARVRRGHPAGQAARRPTTRNPRAWRPTWRCSARTVRVLLARQRAAS